MNPESQSPSQTKLAFEDARASLLNVRFWLTLAWVDILQRYRGSLLGPFWLTVSTGAFILGLGPLYSELLGSNLKTYLPYLTVGLIVWTFISSAINESCSGFIVAGPLMKQMRIPRLTHILHLIARNAIIFVHSIPLYFIVYIWFGLPWSWDMFWALPGFFLLCGILTNIAIIFAIISVRFRDFIQIVLSVMQIAFFVTPIIWHVDNRPMLKFVVDINPLAAMIDLIRDPLLREPMSMAHLVWTVGGFFILSLTSFLIFARYRQRIIYWV